MDKEYSNRRAESIAGQESLLGMVEDLSFDKSEKLLISTCETVEEEQTAGEDILAEPPPSIADLLPKEEVQVQEASQPSLPAIIAMAVPVIAVKEMQLAALCFLENQLARQLAVAWVSCNGNEARWLEAAGIERALFNDANRLCAALRMNNICQDGGVTDSRAIQYIQQIAAEPLLKQGRRNDKSGKR